MPNFPGDAAVPQPTWLEQKGPDSDVVLLTRLSLSRNCQDFCFPSMMESADKIELLRMSEDVLPKLPGTYARFELDGLSTIRTQLLREQLHLPSSDADFGPGRRLLIDHQARSSVLLNHVDHIAIRESMSGFEVNQLYGQLETIDAVFEARMNYAVTLDLGYLRSEIEKTGNGLRADVLLHLPGLSRDPRFDEVLAHAQREGMRLSRFGSAEGGSVAQVYQLSLEGGLGIREAEMLEKLALVVVEFIHYEREARRSMAEAGGLEYADMLWRDFAVLSQARLLGFAESMELYSRVRLGQSLEILPPTSGEAALFFYGQPGHLQMLEDANRKQTPWDEQQFQQARARLFRSYLGAQLTEH